MTFEAKKGNSTYVLVTETVDPTMVTFVRENSGGRVYFYVPRDLLEQYTRKRINEAVAILLAETLRR